MACKNEYFIHKVSTTIQHDFLCCNLTSATGDGKRYQYDVCEIKSSRSYSIESASVFQYLYLVLTHCMVFAKNGSI